MKLSKNSDKEVSVQQEVVSSDTVSDIVKLSSMITEEEKKINDIYFQIGRLYASLHSEECEGIFGDFISSVNQSKLKTADLFEQIKKIYDSNQDIENEEKTEKLNECTEIYSTTPETLTETVQEKKAEELIENIDVYSAALETKTETSIQEPIPEEKAEEQTKNTNTSFVIPEIEAKTPIQETASEEKTEELGKNTDISSVTPEAETPVQETVSEEKAEKPSESVDIYSSTPETSEQKALLEEKPSESIDIYSTTRKEELLHKNDIVQNTPSTVENTVPAQQNVNAVQNNKFSKGFKFCQYCGQKLPSESRFCSECGQRVSK